MAIPATNSPNLPDAEIGTIVGGTAFAPGTMLPLTLAAAILVFFVLYMLVVFFICTSTCIRRSGSNPHSGPKSLVSPPGHEMQDMAHRQYNTVFTKYIADDISTLRSRTGTGSTIRSDETLSPFKSPTKSMRDANDHDSVVDSIMSIELYPHAPILGRDKFHRTMGLKKPDDDNWLTVDKALLHFWKVRTEILSYDKDEALRYDLLNPKVQNACQELLHMVTSFLLERYPDFYGVFTDPHGRRSISNKLTHESFDIEAPFRTHPLEICARLTMEDFNILAKNDVDEHCLVASATLFPAGWRLKDRLGWSVTQLHANVPQWKSKISGAVENYFSRLSLRNNMERNAYFIQICPAKQDLRKTLFIQKPDQFYPGNPKHWHDTDIVVRKERQTFRRLPYSEAVLFTVRTSMEKLVDMDEDELGKLAVEIRSWPEDVAKYRGRDIWGDLLLKYADDKCRISSDDF